MSENREGGTRVLALVSEPVSADALRSALGDEEAANAEVLVVAPALISRTRWIFADPDPAIERAEEVQEETTERLVEDGVDAAGNTGESDPLLALQDALATWPADRIVVFDHPDSQANWLEEGLAQKAQERFDVPVDEIVVER
jgi:hypothetical protein